MRYNGRRLAWDVDMKEGPRYSDDLESVGAWEHVVEVVLANAVLAIG